MALAPKMGRETAHDALSKIAIAMSQGKSSLIDLLSQDGKIEKVFDRGQLEKLIDANEYLGQAGLMTHRVLASLNRGRFE